ncbi:hypothetical protein D9M71_239080 [compost metagenome]
MASALETIDGNGVDPQTLRLQRMTDGDALVDHLQPGGLGLGDIGAGVVARRLEDLHPAGDDHVEVLVIGRRIDRRQQRQVHPERLVGHRLTTLDLPCQMLGVRLGQRSENAHPTGIGDRCSHFRAADPHHAALDDRVANAEEFCDACFHRNPQIGRKSSAPTTAESSWRVTQRYLPRQLHGCGRGSLIRSASLELILSCYRAESVVRKR